MKLIYMFERRDWGSNKARFAEKSTPRKGLPQVVGAVQRRRCVVLYRVRQLSGGNGRLGPRLHDWVLE